MLRHRYKLLNFFLTITYLLEPRVFIIALILTPFNVAIQYSI